MDLVNWGLEDRKRAYMAIMVPCFRELSSDYMKLNGLSIEQFVPDDRSVKDRAALMDLLKGRDVGVLGSDLNSILENYDLTGRFTQRIISRADLSYHDSIALTLDVLFSFFIESSNRWFEEHPLP